jgi:histidine triad (HIT) family protein
VAADCVFCKIRDGQIPSVTIREDERTLAFMDIHPLAPGHCLVVVKAHAPSLVDVAEEDLGAAIAAAQKVARALYEVLRPEGLNMLQANGEAAFQSVPHFHLHLIPRWTGDGKGFDWKPVPGDRDEIQRTGQRLKARLA